MSPSPATLWRALSACLHQLCARFGLPSALASRMWLTRAQHSQICAWLRPLEALLRRLVFLDALAVPCEPPALEAKARHRRPMGAACGAYFHPENSESWRVAFDPRQSVQRPRAYPPPASSPSFDAVSSAPCALRIEALIRVFNQREQLARRLARRLRLAPSEAPRYTKTPHPGAAPLWTYVDNAARLCRRALAVAPTANTS